MMLVNGEIADCVPITDRGFQYGDGLFTTIEVVNGKAVFLQQHIKRLQNGCSRLLIAPLDWLTLTQEAERLSDLSFTEDGKPLAVLKIIITRGSGGRGYRQPDLISPTRVLSIHAYPEYPDAFWQQGVNTRFCRTRLGLNADIAGIKHLNRLEQILARSEWSDIDIQEGLMSDIKGFVIEGTMTNLFFVKNNIFYTPTVTTSGVAGIMRSVIIELLERNGLRLIECEVDKNTLLTADEIFLSNAIIGLWPVKQIEAYQFSVGKMTRELQIRLSDYKHEVNNIA